MNTYQELLVTHGYQVASLYAYLVNAANNEGQVVTSVAQLSKISGLSIQQTRSALACCLSTNKITSKTTNKNTILTICEYGIYPKKKRGAQQAKQQAKQQTKEHPLIPPSSLPPITPILSPPIIPQESTIHYTACERFEAWLSEHCPYIRKHYKMMTDAELEKLKEQYGAELIAETCSDIENRVDLRKKYSHLYRTLLNWLKKRHENNRTTNTPTTKEQRLTEAEQLVYRLAQQDGGSLWQS